MDGPDVPTEIVRASRIILATVIMTLVWIWTAFILYASIIFPMNGNIHAAFGVASVATTILIIMAGFLCMEMTQ